MEVHHHPKVDPDSHRKKKFKEYFSEFLMIFLAVTLGFFAESLREKISEHHREVNYMRSIVNDLKADTSELNKLKPKQDILLKHFNTALSIPPQQLRDPALQDSFYYHYMYFYSFVSYFVAHNEKISQIQKMNGLTFSRQDVIDSLSELELFYNFFLLGDNSSYIDLNRKTNDLGAKVISCPGYMTSIKLPVPSISHDLPVFITVDLPTIRELYNDINMQKGQLEQCIFEQEDYRTRAERLLAFINGKYHFTE